VSSYWQRKTSKINPILLEVAIVLIVTLMWQSSLLLSSAHENAKNAPVLLHQRLGTQSVTACLWEKKKTHHELEECIFDVFCVGIHPRPGAHPLVGCSPTLWLSQNGGCTRRQAGDCAATNRADTVHDSRRGCPATIGPVCQCSNSCHAFRCTAAS